MSGAPRMPLATSTAPTRIGVRGLRGPSVGFLLKRRRRAAGPSAPGARGARSMSTEDASTSPAERWTSDSRNAGVGFTDQPLTERRS